VPGAYNPELALQQELSGGERLLWSGRPGQGMRLRPSDALLIPFSLLWGGFAVFWEASVIKDNAPILFKVWGIPFVLMGLYMIFGRFPIDAWQRKYNVYGVTDQRVLIISRFFTHRVKSLNLRTLGDISLTESRDGSGTIVLGAPSPFGWWANAGWPGYGRYATPSLEMIPQARTVFDLITQAQKSAH